MGFDLDSGAMIKLIAVCARVGLLLVLFTQSFEHPNTDARGGIAAMFDFYQPATSTAVISPTANTVSLTPTNTVLPTAQPTNTVLPPTTYTAQVTAPSGSLLDRLTRNRPGIWGMKAFYVTLGGVYIILLLLFLRLIFRLARYPD